MSGSVSLLGRAHCYMWLIVRMGLLLRSALLVPVSLLDCGYFVVSLLGEFIVLSCSLLGPVLLLGRGHCWCS